MFHLDYLENNQIYMEENEIEFENHFDDYNIHLHVTIVLLLIVQYEIVFHFLYHDHHMLRQYHY